MIYGGGESFPRLLVVLACREISPNLVTTNYSPDYKLNKTPGWVDSHIADRIRMCRCRIAR